MLVVVRGRIISVEISAGTIFLKIGIIRCRNEIILANVTFFLSLCGCGEFVICIFGVILAQYLR